MATLPETAKAVTMTTREMRMVRDTILRCRLVSNELIHLRILLLTWMIRFYKKLIILNLMRARMPIVSISINDALLSEMEAMKKQLGYSGKSELLRAALRTLI